MAIAKNFDPNNYETRTKTITMSPGGVYALGDDYVGGQTVHIFRGAGFTVTQNGVPLVADVNYTLIPDTMLTVDYGINVYSGIKSLTVSGVGAVTYQYCGAYDDAGIVVAHENRLNGHDQNISDINALDTAQNVRMSEIETKDIQQDAGIQAHTVELADHEARIEDVESKESYWSGKINRFWVANMTSLAAVMGMNKGDYCDVDDDGSGPATYKYNGTAWQKWTDADIKPDALSMTDRSDDPATITGKVQFYCKSAKAFLRSVSLGICELVRVLPSGLASITSKQLPDMPAAYTSADAAKVPSIKSDGSGYELVSIATVTGAGNVVSNDTSATDGEIVVTDGTTGKLHKKSGTLLSTLLGWFDGNGNAVRATRISAIGSWRSGATILDEIKTLCATYNGSFIVHSNTDAGQSPPDANAWAHIEVNHSDVDNIIVKWRSNNNLQTHENVYAGGAWTGWKKLTDASGNAITANNALSLGGKTYASLFDANGNAMNALSLGGKTYASLFDANGRPVLTSAYVPSRHNLSSGERAGSTTYTNATGKDMVVCVYGRGAEGSMSYAVIDNLELLGDSYTPGNTVSYCFPVPAGSTYKVVFGAGTQTITRWSEIY